MNHDDADECDELARSYSMSRLGLDEVRLISASNNRVYAVLSENVPVYALKVLVDLDIDLDLWEIVRRELSTQVKVVETVSRESWGHPHPRTIVVTRYRDSENLADYLRDHSFESIAVRFSRMAVEIIRSTAAIEPPRPGYGPFKEGVSLHESPSAYYSSQTERFSRRIAAAARGDNRDWLRFGRSLTDAMTDRIARSSTALVPVDVNLKNFLIDDEGDIVLVNIPIFVNGPIEHGLASFAFQARGHGMADQLADSLCRSFSSIEPSDLAIFECYNALGILAFHAEAGYGALLEAPIWGSETKLIDALETTARAAGVRGV